MKLLARSTSILAFDQGRSSGTPTQTDPALKFVDIGDGTLVLETNQTGTVTVDLAGGTPFDGSYLFNPIDLLTGPINLASPSISGPTQPVASDTLSATDGLWVFDANNEPMTFTYQWQQDAAGGVSFSDINGATSPSIVIPQGTTGYRFRCVVTGTDSNGARSAPTSGILTAASGYAETAATTLGSAYCVMDTAPADAAEILFMFSGTPSTDGSTFKILGHAGNTRTFLRLESDGTGRLRVNLNSGKDDLDDGTPFWASGDRLTLLGSYTQGPSGGDSRISRLAFWDPANGWRTAMGSESVNTSTINVDQDPVSVFADAAGGFVYSGTIFRAAIWTGAAGDIPDITSASVRDHLINSGTGATVDPNNSQNANGFPTPVLDMYGGTAAFNAATNNGSGGTLTRMGTFT